MLTAPAACRYLAGTGAGFPPDPQHAQSASLALERAGLVTVGLAAAVRVGSARCRRRPAPRRPRNCSAGRCARQRTPYSRHGRQDQPRSGLAAQMRACAASLLRHAGDALWDGGSCHRVLLTAGQSLAAAAAGRPGGRLVAGGRRPLRAAARPRPSRHAGRGRAAGRRAAGRGAGTPTPCTARGGSATAGTACSAPATRPPSPPGSASAGHWRPPANAGEALTVLREAAARSERAHGPGDPGALAALTTSTPPRSWRPATPPPRCASASGRWPAASGCTARPIPRPWPPRCAWPAPAWPTARPKTPSASTSASWPPASRPSAPTTPTPWPRGPAWPPPTTPPGRSATRCASTSRPAPATSARSAPTTPSPWPAARTWPAPTTRPGSSATPSPCCATASPAPSRPCPRATRSPAGCGRYRTASPRTLAAE